MIAAHPEADLAVFPELFLSGYTLAPTRGLARGCASALEAVAGQAAQTRTAVAIGFAEEWQGGIANAVALLDTDGRAVGTYRKTHLFSGEREAYRAGDRQLVVRLANRLVAPLVCFDVEFPEPARAVARAGAELLAVVSANMEPYAAEHELLTRARALENRLPLVYVNCVGSERGFRFVGGSRVVAGDGRVVAQLSDAEEETRVVEIPARPVGAAAAYLRQLGGELPVDRPDLTPSEAGGTA